MELDRMRQEVYFAAVEWMFGRHHDSLVQLAEGLLMRDGAAEETGEDVVQIVFLRVLARQPDAAPIGPSYLRKCVARCVAERRRRSRSRAKWVDEFVLERGSLRSPSPSPDRDLEQNIARELIDVLVDRLPPGQRRAFILRYMHGLRPAEVATMLDISAESARKQANRAFRRVKAMLNCAGGGRLESRQRAD